VLYAHGLSIYRGGGRALSDASFVIRGGQVVACIGRGPAGHHALVGFLGGNGYAWEGTLRIGKDGVEGGVPITDPPLEGIISLDMLPVSRSISVLEDLFLLRGDLFKNLFWSEGRMEKRAQDLLGAVGLKVPTSMLLERLSPLELTLLGMAKALDQGGRLLILKDSFAEYPSKDLFVLQETISSLKARGIAIMVYADGVLSDCMRELSDAVWLFRGGYLVKKMVGARFEESLSSVYLEEEAGTAPSTIQEGRADKPLLEVLLGPQSVAGQPLLTLRGGEIANLVCYDGRIRESVFSSLQGDSRNPRLRLALDGCPLPQSGLLGRLRKKVVIVRDLSTPSSVCASLPVADNLILPSIGKIKKFGLFFPPQAGTALRRQLHKKGYNLPLRMAECTDLQRLVVSLERWRVFRPRAMVFYDPFVGMNDLCMEKIREYVRLFAQDGVAVLIVSSLRLPYQDLCSTSLVLAEKDLPL